MEKRRRIKFTKGDTYTTTSDNTARQLFNCTLGKHQFSELFRKHGSFGEYEQTAKLICYGLHAEAIADILNKDIRTIHEWQTALGIKAKSFHISICILFKLCIGGLQMDEIWSFLGNKAKQLWLFSGIEPDTKFWLHFELGSRTKHNATKLVAGIRRVIGDNQNKSIFVTTDKLSAYVRALSQCMPGIDYSYLQIVKIRYKRVLITVKKDIIKGSIRDFPLGTQNTSFIERLNLTLRLRISYIHRKTLGYCKKKENFVIVTWVNLFNYNYNRLHKGLRYRFESKHRLFRRECRHFTPAMKKQLADSPLSWRFLITSPILDHI